MLTLALVCVGRMKAGAERDLATRYLDRARAGGRALGLAVELKEIAESKARRPADRKAEEAQAIRQAAGRARLLLLDETGASITSEAFATLLKGALDTSGPGLALVVGGADGLDATLYAEAAHAIAFGAMTWPHQLVRIMAAEQVYRSITILAGHPYHRA